MHNKQRLTLVRRGFEKPDGKVLWLAVGVLSIPFVFTVIALWLPLDYEFVDKLAESIRKRGTIESLLQFSLPMVLLVPLAVRARLVLDETGIIYQSGIPKKLQFIRLDWQYRWSDISVVAFKKQAMVSPLFSAVIFKVDNKVVRVVPYQWVDPDNPLNKKSFKENLAFSKAKLYKQVYESPVMKFLENLGILGSEDTIEDPVDTLNSNRMAQFIAGLFIFSVIYFVLDVFFLLSEFYVPTMPWPVFALAGCAGAFVAYRLLRKEKLHMLESGTMALLFGLGAGLVSYPLLIHVNTWTDQQGLISYAYERGEKDLWLPRNKQMPVLVFDRSSRYWSQYSPGEEKVFELRRGGLGFTQINMAPIYEDQKKFYEKH